MDECQNGREHLMGFCEGLSGAQFSLMFSLTALVKNLNINLKMTVS